MFGLSLMAISSYNAPFKTKIKKITYSQPIMTQDIHSHSLMEEKERDEEIADQSKTKNQLGELKILHLYVRY